MKILFLTQYYPPEVGATQSRAYDMVSHWVSQDHKVTVITEFPNHPSGIIPSKFRWKFFEREMENGIEVIRVWVKATPKKNFINRIFFYLSYCINAVIIGLSINKTYDLIFATSPPLFTAAAGLILHKFKKTQFLVEIRDLWPESAIELGELNNKIAIKWATWLEEKCYRNSSRIIVVTHGIGQRIKERGYPENKIKLVENGADTDLFKYQELARQDIRSNLQLNDKFIAIYAGILGVAQGLQVVLDAANALRDNPQIHFLLLGEGPKKQELIGYASKLNLNNVNFLPEVPRNLVPGFLSAADVALVPLQNKKIFQDVIPSKIFDAWACERPVILGVDGEARRILENCQGGRFVIPENYHALADAILEFSKNPEAMMAKGKRGRNFTATNYSRKKLAEKLTTILKDTLSSEKNPQE